MGYQSCASKVATCIVLSAKGRGQEVPVAVTLRPQRIEQEHMRRLQAQPHQESSGAGHLQGALQKTKRGISRFIDSHQDGLLERKEFEPRVRAAKERLVRLEKVIREQLTEDHEGRALRVVIGRLQDFADRSTRQCCMSRDGLPSCTIAP